VSLQNAYPSITVCSAKLVICNIAVIDVAPFPKSNLGNKI
jgi:hypothetical protein